MKPFSFRKIFSSSHISWIIYGLVLVCLLKLGSLFSSRMEYDSFNQRIFDFFQKQTSNVSLKTTIKMPDGKIFIQVLSGQNFLAYASPFRVPIHGKLVAGWDIFSENWKYQDFHVDYWEGEKDWLSFVNLDTTRREIVEEQQRMWDDQVLLLPFYLDQDMAKYHGEFSRDMSAFLENRMKTAFQIESRFSVQTQEEK